MENRCLSDPICKCDICYFCGYFYIIIANIFTYYILVLNKLNIDYNNETKNPVIFILYCFAEFIIIGLSRLICIGNEKEYEPLL